MALTPEQAFNALKTLYPNTIRIELNHVNNSYTRRYFPSGAKEDYNNYEIDVDWDDTTVYPPPLEKVLKLGYTQFGYFVSTDEGASSKYLHCDGVMRDSTNQNGQSLGYYGTVYNALASAYRYNSSVLIKLDKSAVNAW